MNLLYFLKENRDDEIIILANKLNYYFDCFLNVELLIL